MSTESRKNSVVVVGSSNTDMIVKTERLPKPGETILGGEFVTAAGGKGANQAVAAARAGAAVTLVARLGRDMFGDRAAAGFAAEGINVDFLVRDASAPSGVALIFVGGEGENSIAVASGANSKLTPEDVRRARSAVRDSHVLLLQLETPIQTVAAAAELGHAAGVRVILNPAPGRPVPESLLRRLYLLTPNETEAELLTGRKVSDAASAAKAAEALLVRGVPNVLITLGERGAYLQGQDGRGLVAPYKVRAVDTTAAGDVFNGALAVALAEGRPLLEAARFANAAAALSVTRLGAQPSAPSRAEIERMLKPTGRVGRNLHSGRHPFRGSLARNELRGKNN
jgi:ribokinase